MSLDNKGSIPAPSASTDRPISIGTNSPKRSGSTGKYNIKINTSAALARPHIKTSFGESTIMENTRPESRMRIRRRSSKGSVQSNSQPDELHESSAHVNNQSKKDEPVNNETKHYPNKMSGREAYMTPISPPFSLSSMSPTSPSNPYEDVFDTLNRQGYVSGNRIRIDTNMLHSHGSYHLPDTPQSMFSMQSPASSANTFYSPLSPRGHISSPGGMTPWRRGSMIPTVPELESDQPGCESEERGRGSEIDAEHLGKHSGEGRGVAGLERQISKNHVQGNGLEDPSVQHKMSQSVPQMQVVSPIESAFDMSSLQAVIESNPRSETSGTTAEEGTNHIPYHVQLAQNIHEDSVTGDSPQSSQGNNSAKSQLRVHPIDTSVGGDIPTSGYLNYFQEPPTLGSPLGGWRRGSRGITPQSPAGISPFSVHGQEDISPMNFVNPRRAASNIGAYNSRPHGQGLLHPASALNTSSRYSLGGDPHLPRNQLRRRKSVESFKEAVPEAVVRDGKNPYAKEFNRSPQEVQTKPSIEIIRARIGERTVASNTNEAPIQATSRMSKSQYTRRARRRSNSRGPRIRRVRSRSHFRNASKVRDEAEGSTSSVHDEASKDTSSKFRAAQDGGNEVDVPDRSHRARDDEQLSDGSETGVDHHHG
ncbi:hypothetical protein AAP_01713 [Ascosphaera apis ARSEF 7405]|uniref:Uncharacterized protein n=1 Tax=Ascosphaera apis ARSEF 7405 TaxID=392613 RepID=A0A168BFA5_9EURO|nr:hypothetical protein AAP_01713 [Ascosphaera apis ARSEF 7405]